MQYGPKTMSHFSTIGLKKNNNKKRTSRSFSILFSVLESSEIALSHIFRFFQCCFYKYLKALTKLISLAPLHLTDPDDVINLVT